MGLVELVGQALDLLLERLNLDMQYMQVMSPVELVGRVLGLLLERLKLVIGLVKLVGFVVGFLLELLQKGSHLNDAGLDSLLGGQVLWDHHRCCGSWADGQPSGSTMAVKTAAAARSISANDA